METNERQVPEAPAMVLEKSRIRSKQQYTCSTICNVCKLILIDFPISMRLEVRKDSRWVPVLCWELNMLALWSTGEGGSAGKTTHLRRTCYVWTVDELREVPLVNVGRDGGRKPELNSKGVISQWARAKIKSEGKIRGVRRRGREEILTPDVKDGWSELSDWLQ